MKKVQIFIGQNKRKEILMEIVQCEENEYIVIEAGSTFFLNAGICGFIKMLEYAKAEKEEDYLIEKQQLKVKKEFLLQHDLADLYVKTMVNRFKEQTKYHTVLEKKNIVLALGKKEELTEKELETLQKIYKEMIDMLEKKSFLAGYEIIEQETDAVPITVDMIKEFKKSKAEQKYQLYLKLCELLEQPEVSEILIMKELMYSKINDFYDNISFLSKENLRKSIIKCYQKDFVNPLLEEIQKEKKTKKRCIECLNYASNKRANSFMLKTTDDVNKKKSHYWNQKPDAYICPLCAFLYTLVPLGVQFCGRTSVFINENGSIPTMLRIMNAYEYKQKEQSEQDEKASSKSKIFRIFTTEAMNMTKESLDNIQVVVKMNEKDYYEMSVISPEIVRGFIKGKKDFEVLEKKYIKPDKNYINIYDEVLESILAKRHLYVLMDKLLFYELKENRSIDYIWNILKLQIYFNGGKQMDKLYELAQRARNIGNEMRNELVKDSTEKDKDNALRGLVYKLNNAVSTRDLDMFLDTIIRIYSGNGLAIPSIILECYRGETIFQTIGRAYILGLKSGFVQEKEDTEKEIKDNE